ncbi:hypothetical protein RF158_00510, partial [Escherichia coli]|nr:hypothetical protein [Escherichia coli]
GPGDFLTIFLFDWPQQATRFIEAYVIRPGVQRCKTLYDLSERLRLRGWQVPAFTLGGEATDIVVMRIMCRRGFEMDFAELLLEDYKASLKYLSDHPKLQGIAQQNSFKHT